ncbi:MAG: hypothetical protein A2Y81_09375 [Nitrospirae bacterium RBG_13_43_8]|nr:MAG: hypothetical protein A2Y81_09375 [Nitrospirae bacterium RBG_13_43_8]
MTLATFFSVMRDVLVNYLAMLTFCFTNSRTLLSFWLVQNPSLPERFQTSWNDIYPDFKIKEGSNRVDIFSKHGIINALLKSSLKGPYQ